MEISRRLYPFIKKDLTRKMVLLAGPRQCGKTSLAKTIAKSFSSAHYYNWDVANDRKSLLRNELDDAKKLWLFDELHKYRRWRNWLKGIYDEFHETHPILVTGSAKLDVYSRGGDSLQGRYFFHRMHPLTLGELEGMTIRIEKEIPQFSQSAQNTLSNLLKLGGFPEPFLSGSETEAERWRNQYGTLLVREEVRDLEKTEDLDSMELLFDRLGDCVGSPLSINSLREDLELSHGTVSKWLGIFEKLYGVFRVAPFGPPRIKAIKKEPKLYFWDWGRVANPGARFENLVAVHLMTYCHWLTDQQGKKAELRYFRSKAKHEVDFIVIVNHKPVVAVECKLADESPGSGLRYLLERVSIPQAFQISFSGRKDYVAGITRIRALPASQFLSALP